MVLPAVAAAVLAWRTEGSLAASDWLPLAVLAALLLATVALAGAAVRPPRAALAAVAALLLLAGWTAASAAWSASPSGARDEALLTALYAVCLALGPVALPHALDRERAIALVTGVLAALGGLAALKLALTGDPWALFYGGRLDFPVSYVNACAALFMLGLWPAVATASRRHGSLVVRAGAVGAGAIFLALTVAAQSKGAVLAGSVSALLVLALAPGRLRLLPPLLLAAAPAAAASGALTAPYRSTLASTANGAGWTVLAAGAAGTALGLGYAALDRRLELDERRRRLAGRAVAVLVLVGALAAIGGFLVAVPSPGAWTAAKWHAFEHPPSGRDGSSHLTSLGSNRYDFWRVALDEARTHPLHGIGGRGFYSAYLVHGRSAETPLRAHSLYLDALAEEGVPGLLLLLVALGAPLALLARRLRSPAAVGAFGAGLYFCLHASVDWIWTVPAVGAVAFLLLGAGCGGEEAPPPLRRRTGLGVGVAAAALGLIAFAPPWLASRYVDAAYHARSPAADLARARFLDPVSLDPYWAEWQLARTPARQVQALVRARALEPRSVAVLYQLGLSYERAGRRAQALATLRRAQSLDPRDGVVRSAVRSASR